MAKSEQKLLLRAIQNEVELQRAIIEQIDDLDITNEIIEHIDDLHGYQMISSVEKQITTNDERTAFYHYALDKLIRKGDELGVRGEITFVEEMPDGQDQTRH